MMVSVYEMIDNSTTTKDNVLGDDASLLQLHMAMNRLDLDFNQIYSPLFYSNTKKKGKKNNYNVDDSYLDSYEEESQVKYNATKKFPKESSINAPIPIVETPDKSTLIFLTSANRRKIENTKQSRFAWIKYSLESMSSKESKSDKSLFKLVRYFDPYDTYSEDFNWDDLRGYTLLENIKSLKFFYWSPKKKDYVEGITDLKNKFLLTGLKVELTWINSRGNETEITKSFRSSWPLYDSKRDDDAIKKRNAEVQKKRQDKANKK